MVDAWQLQTWEAYRDVARLGRKTRIGGRQRELLWSIFERVRQGLVGLKAVTWSDAFGRLTDDMAQGAGRPFTHAVVDEAQDVGVAELRFLAGLAEGNAPNALFFTGDLGQRIFQQPFSWKSLGVGVRGRSHTLSINHRTSQQIRECADRLLPAAISDVDGNSEGRCGTTSVLSGPPPTVELFDNAAAEAAAVGEWVRELLDGGLAPDEIAILVRSGAELQRARDALKGSGASFAELSETAAPPTGHIAIGTMHLAKGLEFRAVAVVACDEDVLAPARADREHRRRCGP